MVGITKCCTSSTVVVVVAAVVVVVVVVTAAAGLNTPTVALRVVRGNQRPFSPRHGVPMIDGVQYRRGNIDAARGSQGVLFVKLFHLSFTHYLFSCAFMSQLYYVVTVRSFQHQIIAVFFDTCLFHEELSQHLA
jgi:hypothetical protein